MLQRSIKGQNFTQSEQDSIAPSSISLDGQILQLPSTFPQLKKQQPSHLARSQQLIVAQSQGIPFIPSLAGKDGVVLDAPLTSFGKQNWWSALTARFKIQQFLKTADKPSLKDFLQKIVEPDNYSLCWRFRTTPQRRTSVALSLESHSADPIFQIVDSLLERASDKYRNKEKNQAKRSSGGHNFDKLVTRLRVRSKILQHELVYNLNINDICQIGLNQLEKIKRLQTFQIRNQHKKFNYSVGFFQMSPQKISSVTNGKVQDQQQIQQSQIDNDSNDGNDTLNHQNGSLDKNLKKDQLPFLFEQYNSHQHFGKTQLGSKPISMLVGTLGFSREIQILKDRSKQRHKRLQNSNSTSNASFRDFIVPLQDKAQQSQQSDNIQEEHDKNTQQSQTDVNLQNLPSKQATANMWEAQNSKSVATDNSKSESRRKVLPPTFAKASNQDAGKGDDVAGKGESSPQLSQLDKQSQANVLMEKIQKVVDQIKTTSIPYPTLSSDPSSAPIKIDVQTKSPEEIGQIFTSFVNQQVGDFSNSLGVLKERLDLSMRDVRDGKLLDAINNLSNFSKQTDIQQNQNGISFRNKQLPGGFLLFGQRRPQIKIFMGIQNHALLNISNQLNGGQNINNQNGANKQNENLQKMQQVLGNGVIRIVGSLGAAVEYGKLQRRVLDYTQASIRWDCGIEKSPISKRLLNGQYQRSAEANHGNGDHMLQSIWQSITLSATQQLFGPIRLFGDLRLGVKPISNDIQKALSQTTVRGKAFKLASTMVDTSKQMQVFQQGIFGLDFVAPGGVGKLAVWCNPTMKQTMLEFRI